MMKRKVTISLTLITLFILVVAAFYPREPSIHQARIFTFGTYVDISLRGVSRSEADTLLQGLESELNTVNHQWHAWRPSLLTKVNQAFQRGDCHTVTPSEKSLMQLSQELSLKSGERFHPGIGRLIQIWGFQRDNSHEPWQPPSAVIVEEFLRQRPSMADLYFSGEEVCSRHRHLALDFGGFAKGFGVEEAIAWLSDAGVQHAIVNAGGDLKVLGSADERPWRVAIKKPGAEGALAVIEPRSGESVFTSGTYERSFEYQGRKFHHIIDPKTGKPASAAISATVLDSDARKADAAATALLVAGPEGALNLANDMGLTYWLVIDPNQQIFTNAETLERLLWVAEARVTLLGDETETQPIP